MRYFSNTEDGGLEKNCLKRSNTSLTNLWDFDWRFLNSFNTSFETSLCQLWMLFENLFCRNVSSEKMEIFVNKWNHLFSHLDAFYERCVGSSWVNIYDLSSTTSRTKERLCLQKDFFLSCLVLQSQKLTNAHACTHTQTYTHKHMFIL